MRSQNWTEWINGTKNVAEGKSSTGYRDSKEGVLCSSAGLPSPLTLRRRRLLLFAPPLLRGWLQTAGKTDLWSHASFLLLQNRVRPCGAVPPVFVPLPSLFIYFAAISYPDFLVHPKPRLCVCVCCSYAAKEMLITTELQDNVSHGDALTLNQWRCRQIYRYGKLTFNWISWRILTSLC